MFRWEGGGFFELHLTLLPWPGLVYKSVSSIFTSVRKAAVLIQLQVCSEWAGEPALAMGHL